MVKNLLKRIAPVVLGVSLLTNIGNIDRAYAEKPKYGVINKREIELDNDYKTETRKALNELRIIGGIAAGTVKIEKTGTGYKAEGYFNELLYPEIFDKVCELADRDNNKLITEKETGNLLKTAYEIAIKENN